MAITETTVHVTYRRLTQDEIEAEQGSVIGRPIANSQIYILDGQKQPVPIGVAGEIYIGGAGVARGYLNRPELTAERFIADPFSVDAEARLYKTGDLGRWRADGNIEYLGRNDHQVKIRGFRIELGEIEAQLSRHPQVKEAVVIAREDIPGDKRLVAYLTLPTSESTEPAAELSIEALRTHLRTALPEYMIPSAFVMLEALPLTPNGKLDRKALPAPDHTAIQAQQYEAPQGEVEETLAVIWQDILHIERVGRHDNFFDLGGHSLLAVQVIARIRQSMGRDMALRDLFEYPSLQDLAKRLQGTDSSTLVPIKRADRSQPLPLSFAQQRLWFLDQFEGAGAAYHIPGALRLQGPLDRCVLQATLDTIVARHEVLRTTFVSIDGVPVQVIAPEASFTLEFIDLSAQTQADSGAKVRRQIAAEVQASFDLSTGPLIRGRLIRLADGDHILFVTMHHIISDGWSMGVLIQEVAAIYTAYRQEHPNPLPPLAIQYADYAQWQRNWLVGEALHTQLSYWKQQLSGTPALLDLPTDRPRPSVQSYAGASSGFALNPELSTGLKVLAKRYNATLYMTLYTGWAILLSRLSGQDDIVIGAPVANRQRAEVEGLIGFFVNTLALRTNLSANPSVSALLEQVKGMTLAAYTHQDVPFEQVVKAVMPLRSMSHAPVFQTMFALQNTPQGEFHLPELTFTPQEIPHNTAQFDLTLSLEETEGAIVGGLEYASDLFDRETIKRWIGHFKAILTGMVQDAEQKIGELELLDANERRQVLEEFNATQVAYPQDKLIHQLFEVQAEKNPDAVAVVYEDQQLSYGELNRRANQLARYLRKQGVVPDTLVAICVERSLEMVVGLLGVLKAGGAYVPLDPAYPAERLEYMLADAAPKVVLTQDKLKATLPSTDAQVIALDTDWGKIAKHTGSNLNSQTLGLTPEHLAYVIYTSGSTGQPKGVMVEHRGVVNFLNAMQSRPSLSASDCMLAVTTLSFDIAALEMYLPLLSGARLVLASREMAADANFLAKAIDDFEVTVLQATPSTWRLLLSADWRGQSKLKALCGGEALTTELARKVQSKVGVLWNLYGPTETTIWSCYRQITAKQNSLQAIESIGRPIANTQIYILDGQKQPVPIGVAGEIYIGGAGVARGYLNRPELTAERFIADPFSVDAEARLYKTGDLGRWRADGNIEYLGRNDHQVKIRGFRIELGEIEAQLSRHPQVKEAVVIAREDIPGDKRLVAYLTLPTSEGTEPAAELSIEALRTHLRTALPEYMIPSAFVMLEALPLTPNGKLDRKALPAPDHTAIQAQQYEAPQGEVEETLAVIWQDILHIERVGRHDNFFDLGGHSLLAVQVIARIRQSMGRDMALRDLFEYPTIRQLAVPLQRGYQTWTSNINPVPLRSNGNQSPLFFVHELSGDVLPYMPLAQQMTEDIPIYGLQLQATSPYSTDSSQTSVEAMAAQYVEAIRLVQPHGPYRLAGWSVGGLIAYEIANQLIGDDESVEFLGMIDTYRHSGYNESMGSDDDVSLFLMYVRAQAPMIDESEFIKLIAIPELDYIFDQCKQTGILPPEITLEEVYRRLKVVRAINRAIISYYPQPIQIPIYLFAADNLLGDDPSRGWGTLVGERLNLKPIGGTHASIMEQPHLQRLADAITQALEDIRHRVQCTAEPAYSPIITIQIGKHSVTPVFCVPGAGANVTCFVSLTQALGEQVPVYGLQPRGLDGLIVPHSSVPAAARAYIQAIRQIYPKGPYRLVGHSFGGWVVFEIARQLIAAGEVVDPVVMLDTNPPSDHGVKQRQFSRIDTIMELIDILEQASGQSFCLEAIELESLNEDEQLKCLLQRMIAIELMPKSSKLLTIRGILRVFAANLNTIYMPAIPFSGDVVLVRAEEKSVSINNELGLGSADLTAAWLTHAPNLTVLDVSANHMTLLNWPNIDSFVERLRQIWG